MKLSVDSQIFQDFPEAIIGVVFASEVNNDGESSEVTALLREVEASLGSRLGSGPLAEHPRIACWREAYRKFGAKPKDYPSSIENLAKRVLRGESVRHINKLVDIYNYISLKHLLPVGGEDEEKIEGDVRLTIAGENETPVKLLGEPEARPPYPKEVIYKDNQGTICRRWNWKEADRTKLTEQTRQAILVVEGLPPTDKEQVEAAVEELAELVTKYCGAKVSRALLSKEVWEVAG
ncbi:MAG: phenylalanine--tRNA ligase beta subunit-related protein [bacterium]|nr:phenylalanine--tRNA ligase beta subunit-related protein [bacterium]